MQTVSPAVRDALAVRRWARRMAEQEIGSGFVVFGAKQPLVFRSIETMLYTVRMCHAESGDDAVMRVVPMRHYIQDAPIELP